MKILILFFTITSISTRASTINHYIMLKKIQPKMLFEIFDIQVASSFDAKISRKPKEPTSPTGPTSPVVGNFH